MPFISIRIAKTDTELDVALRFRHEIFAHETKTFSPTGDGRHFDRFDVYPGTTTVLARDQAKPEQPCVATLRFAPYGPLGLPSEEFHDFQSVIDARQHEGRFATMGMLAIAKAHRRTHGLLVTLVAMAWRELRRSGVRFIVAPCLPPMARVIANMGGVEVGPSFRLGEGTVTPMLLDMEHATPATRAAARDPANLLVEELTERRIYRGGASVIEEGARGDEAFIVMHGTARLVIGGEPTPYRIGPGELFGEFALFGDGVRAATITAESKILDVGVVPRDEFERRLDHEPGFARRLIDLLIRRLRVRDPRPGAPELIDAANLDFVTAQHVLQGSEWGREAVPVRWVSWSVGGDPRAFTELIQNWENKGIVHVDEAHLLHVLDADALQGLTTPTSPRLPALDAIRDDIEPIPDD